MSIIKLSRDNFERYDLVARPEKIFRSSSSTGVDGDVLLMKDASPSLKDISRFQEHRSASVNQFNEEASWSWSQEVNYDPTKTGADAAMQMVKIAAGLEKVNSASQGLRYRKRQEIFRTVPGTKLNKEFLKKKVVKNVLFNHYRGFYDSMEWGYTNYNCLNFYENENVPSNTSLIYPAPSGTYAPDDKFTMQFYIKPKKNSDTLSPSSEIAAGTILHMSSCYAISLLTGSNKDKDGISSGYRIVMQLSQSADINPKKLYEDQGVVTAKGTSANKGMIFASSDNSITRDKWTHVSIRWPGALQNGGTGSFMINGVEDTKFAINSSSVMQITTSDGAGLGNPDAVFLGNYYDGKNQGASTIARFFNNNASYNEGVSNLLNAEDDPIDFYFNNHLRAEVHEIKMFNSYRTNAQISFDKKRGRASNENDMIFYVPPFFVEETRERNVLQSPFMDNRGRTNDPFNVALSFGVGSLDINLENFTREMVKNEYPRLYNLTSSTEDTSVYEEGVTGNDVLYSKGSARKKLRTILPCDNGFYRPEFSILGTGSDGSNRFIDSYGAYQLDLVSLDNLVKTGSLLKDLSVLDMYRSPDPNAQGSLIAGNAQWGSLDAPSPFGPRYFLNDLMGASPEDPSIPPGSILTVLHRTGDPSSNEVVMFDISNMFYGDSITPGSVLIEDLAPTGSAGSFTFKVRDNKRGNLYRADLEDHTEAATWSSVGNVFYEDGIILIKSPHLSFFGKEDFRLTFKGNRTVYVYEVSIPVRSEFFNSSSNPTYKDLRPTSNFNETSDKFTYITGINLHDDNLNVVGKATLSQPFLKREEDRVVIKLRMDF